MTKIHELYVYNAIRDAIINSKVNKIDNINKSNDFKSCLKQSKNDIKQKNLVKKNNYYRGRR